MNIRTVQDSDTKQIQEIVEQVGNFNPVEVKVALELVEDALRNAKSDYRVCVLEDDAALVRGYACYGPTPLTESTFDFYWLAVHPDAQGKGYGRDLIQYVEKQVKAEGGKLVVLETSSTESYGRTMRVYTKSGYEMVAQIRNFYRQGDDKIVFVKYL
jgi:ribosomal protein S18 acetylase RimI-like enzyme